jgi:DNA-binding NtrC family response regulator
VCFCVFNRRTEGQTIHRVLLADDDDVVRDMMSSSLESKGFEVVAVSGVTEALKCIATETFEVLIADSHMPDAGDGFTVISAMRHSQPAALTMLVSGFPHVKSAMEAISLEADEIVLKPDRTQAAGRTHPRKAAESETC